MTSLAASASYHNVLYNMIYCTQSYMLVTSSLRMSGVDVNTPVVEMRAIASDGKI